MSNPDTILSTITEEQVHEWMKAKLLDVQRSGMPTHHFELDVICLGGGSIFVGVTMHACGQCVVSRPTVDEAAAELRRALNNPAELARKKREDADRLLGEAAELETMASGRPA